MSRTGLICSGGGAVMANAFDLLGNAGLNPDWAIVTDRLCGIEEKAEKRGIPFSRIDYVNRTQFSAAAGNWLFNEMKCDRCILLVTRLVGPEVFDVVPCVNIHPSLLPLFPGLGALDATQASGMRVMGATAHRVDQTTDGGSILAQVWSAKPDTMQMIQRVSFAQKLYLMLWANQARFGDAAGSIPPQGDAVAASWAQPCLQHAALQAAFLDFVKSEEIPWPR